MSRSIRQLKIRLEEAQAERRIWDIRAIDLERQLIVAKVKQAERREKRQEMKRG